MIERGRSVVGLLSGGKTALMSHGWNLWHFPVPQYPILHVPTRPRRTFDKLVRKAKRHTKAQIRKAESSTLRYFRSQYYPTTAWSDLRLATLRNEDIVVNALILLFAIGFASTVTVFDFTLLFLNTAYDISALTGVSMSLLVLVVGGVLASLVGWTSAFLMNMMSLAVIDGANRKVKVTIRSTSRKALSMASAVTTAWFVLLVRTALPSSLAVISAVAYLKLYYPEITLPLVPASIFVASLMTWSLVNFIRFSLAPYIVLFEQAPIPVAFRRSSELLKHRGKIFLGTVYLSLMAALGIMYGIAMFIDNLIGYNQYLIFAAFAVFGIVVTNGVLVMLYRKRKLARRY